MVICNATHVRYPTLIPLRFALPFRLCSPVRNIRLITLFGHGEVHQSKRVACKRVEMLPTLCEGGNALAYCMLIAFHRKQQNLHFTDNRDDGHASSEESFTLKPVNITTFLKSLFGDDPLAAMRSSVFGDSS